MGYNPPTNVDCSEFVADFLIGNDWNLVKLRSCLPTEAIQRIINIPIGVDSGLSDRCIWGLTSNGMFSVKTAYELCCGQNMLPEFPWNFIWKLLVFPRIKTFLWCLAQGKIMSNEQRVRRNFSDDPSCQLCTHHTESLQHIFLTCSQAKVIWSNIFIPTVFRRSFSSNFNDWLSHNLQSHYEFRNGINWCGVFATTVWFIWKWRCIAVFDNQFHLPSSTAMVIHHSYHDWFAANIITMNRPTKNQVLLSWTPPSHGTLKLNIDGSRIGSTNCIAAGGLLRNHNGDWIGGFTANLGTGEILLAEMWALYFGLKLASRLNCTNIQVESDSSLVVNLVTNQWNDTHPLHSLIVDCKRLWHGNWVCSIKHIYRECNDVADGPAHLGHSMELGWHVLENPPAYLLGRLDDDRHGRARPRIVIV